MALHPYCHLSPLVPLDILATRPYARFVSAKCFFHTILRLHDERRIVFMYD
ncbi:hypothetical protein [uncultured Alistipes sp.]|uniref:hypothetical protein n=1 Tax=uncultured Alistipes sp. TaxID=538949 RepID=UPI0025891B2E|nr:hypothetical protein [uncultured Alistipes sp.]